MDHATLEDLRTIVSHADCPDGIASALLLHDALPDAQVIFLEHGTPEYAALPAGSGMIFCDIAPPEGRADEFVAAGAVVLDHHRGARAVVERFGARGVFADENREPGVSGALLAYDRVWRLRKGEDAEVHRFAALTGVRDTWQTDHPEWDEACAQATTLSFFGYDALSAQGPRLRESQREVGRRLVAERRATAAETAAKKLFMLSPEVAIYNDRDRLLSDVADHAFARVEALAVVCGFHYKVTSDGRMLLVVAMRSRRGGVDVSAVAQRHGGGGHGSAAGFSLPVTAESPNPVETIREALAR